MKTKTKEPTRKIKPPTEEQYRRAKISQALMYAPPIYPCHDCGWPCIRGYCCHYCDSTNPEGV